MCFPGIGLEETHRFIEVPEGVWVPCETLRVTPA